MQIVQTNGTKESREVHSKTRLWARACVHMTIYTLFIILLEYCLSNALLTKPSKQQWFRESGGVLKNRAPAELLRNKIQKWRPGASESGWRFLVSQCDSRYLQPRSVRYWMLAAYRIVAISRRYGTLNHLCFPLLLLWNNKTWASLKSADVVGPTKLERFNPTES